MSEVSKLCQSIMLDHELSPTMRWQKFAQNSVPACVSQTTMSSVKLAIFVLVRQKQSHYHKYLILLLGAPRLNWIARSSCLARP